MLNPSQTSGTATGDFTTSYKVNSTTVMSGGGAGGMPPIQTQMDFTYAGPCPAGAKPGELVR